jgi:hypothetical protein
LILFYLFQCNLLIIVNGLGITKIGGILHLLFGFLGSFICGESGWYMGGKRFGGWKGSCRNGFGRSGEGWLGRKIAAGFR